MIKKNIYEMDIDELRVLCENQRTTHKRLETAHIELRCAMSNINKSRMATIEEELKRIGETADRLQFCTT